MRYSLWGMARDNASSPTDLQYTGQEKSSNTGLYFYNSRWYDPYLTQFIQPDSIIPDPYNLLDLNRYSYARNNPVRYNDPSGHCVVVCLAIGLTVALVVWLANPEPVYAPPPGFTPPSDLDKNYGDKAFFDTAPGSGDLSDIYSVVTGRTLFTGEEVSPTDRLISGASSLLPFVTAGTVKQAYKAFDIVRYGDKVQDLIPHHGVLDIWASANIPGYIRRNSETPTILLTGTQHSKTIEVFNSWRLEKTGSITGKIDWSTISAKEMQTLTEQMFNAAGVPKEAQEAYIKAFNKYIYEELP